ncbi:hypothetical protein SESBI_07231 [Sesbania bispinosa]|nr:hypothetical protein SESBI_07231 [Sesbania bispinosa]
MQYESESNRVTVAPPPKPPEGIGGASTTKVSFRDKSMGQKEPLVRRERMDLISNKLFRIELEDGNRLKPRCYVADTVLNELWKSWMDAVIVNMLGRSIGFVVLNDRLKKLWQLNGVQVQVDGDGGKTVKSLGKANKFSKLVNHEPQEMSGTPTFSSQPLPPKIWTRKKRQRAKPIIPQPKIYSDDYSKPIMKAVDTALQKLNVKNQVGGPAEREEPSSSTKPLTCPPKKPDEGIHIFAGNLKTSLNVEMVSPNHLHFVDEAKPPDPLEHCMERSLVEQEMKTVQEGEDMEETSVQEGNEKMVSLDSMDT